MRNNATRLEGSRSVVHLRRHAFLLALCVSLVPLALSPAHATMPDGFNHPELHWQVVEAPHFRVIFHQGGERLAQRTAALAEEIYEQVTTDLGQKPESRTPIVLASYADDARYFAVREEKRIYLSAPALNEARVYGEEFLRALLIHEFTHVVTYWASRGWLWDVGEWAGPGLMPAWFVEGVAQAEAYTFNLYGGFLILRSAALENAYTPLAKIDADWPTDQPDRWLTYAQGYSLVSYIAEAYGKKAIAEILDNFAKYRVFEYALKRSLGVDERQLYRDWEAKTRGYYQGQAEGRSDLPPAVEFPLEAVLSARISPDGQRIALLAVKDWDLEDPYPMLYVADRDGSHLRALARNVGIFTSAKLAWSPDSQRLFFAGKRILPNGTMRSGVYSVEVDTGQTSLLTRDLRAGDPDLSPDGSTLAFIVYQDEATLLALCKADGSEIKTITSAQAPYQAFSPSWSPDGQWIAFNCVWPDHSAIALIRPDGSDFRTLTSGKGFDIEPRFSPDGSQIVYASYSGGVPNVWITTVDGSRRWRITDLKAASAFYPVWAPEGDRVYFSALGTRKAALTAADPQAVVGEVLGADEPAEIPSGGELGQYPVRPYRSLGNFRRYITRTMNSGDGMGDTAGLLTEFADPLRQHALSAYTEYGLDSERPLIDVQYTNSQLFTNLSLRHADYIAAPYRAAGATVWDHARDSVFSLSLPSNKSGDLYLRDVTDVTLSRTELAPFRWSAPLVIPPPSTTRNAMTVSWRRTQRVPRQRRETYALSATSFGYALGGDLNATWINAGGSWAFELPDVRHQALLGATYQLYDGEDVGTDPQRQETILTNVGFRWRLANDISTRFWPLLYSGPLTLTVSWQRHELLSGRVLLSGTSLLGNTFRAELLSRGELTRYAPYELRSGATYNDGTQDFDFYLELTTTPLTQPLRQDESDSPSAPLAMTRASSPF